MTDSSSDEIANYSKSQTKQFALICDLLRKEIDTTLPQATSRIYYSAPVWFIDDNPIVGYNVTSKCVNLLFWSGQAFSEPDLVAAGKYKAAQIRYSNVDDVDLASLRRWLKKSQTEIWDYKNIRKNGGKLLRRK